MHFTSKLDASDKYYKRALRYTASEFREDWKDMVEDELKELVSEAAKKLKLNGRVGATKAVFNPSTLDVDLTSSYSVNKSQGDLLKQVFSKFKASIINSKLEVFDAYSKVTKGSATLTGNKILFKVSVPKVVSQAYLEDLAESFEDNDY